MDCYTKPDRIGSGKRIPDEAYTGMLFKVELAA
jgi:hypothetical protein